MLFSGIPRTRLIEEPTPLQLMPNIGAFVGHTGMYVKRDDLIPLGLGGNKVRCLEFWLGDAIRKNADVIVVAGGIVSNQCRLTAAAAAKLGMRCIILHSSNKPEIYNGNVLLNKIMETETIFLGEIDEQARRAYAVKYADELRAKGHTPYIIGTDPVQGALGYVNSALELVWQAESRHIDLKHVFICGSEGMTEAGLLYGLCLFGKSFKLHIVSVEYEIAHIKALVEKIYDGICEKLHHKPLANIEDVAIFYDEYLGQGYAKSTKESLDAVRLLAQKEALFIENTYNSKVFAGMLDLVKKRVIAPGEATCCYQTGGTPALFGQSDLFV